jgi:hypothetical protein
LSSPEIAIICFVAFPRSFPPPLLAITGVGVIFLLLQTLIPGSSLQKHQKSSSKNLEVIKTSLPLRPALIESTLTKVLFTLIFTADMDNSYRLKSLIVVEFDGIEQ